MRNKRVIVGASAAAVTASLAVAGPLPEAQAVAYPVKPEPISIVVSERATQITMDVRSTARRHVVTLVAPGLGPVAHGMSRSPYLTVRGSVPSLRLNPPGCRNWYLIDGDGSRRGVRVCIIDSVIFAFTQVKGMHQGYLVTGAALRYDGSRYVPLAFAPVQVQERRQGYGPWRTATTLTTDRRGMIRGFVRHAPGRVTVRLFVAPTDKTGGAVSSEMPAFVH